MSTNNRYEINKRWRKISDIEERLQNEDLSDKEYDKLNSLINQLGAEFETLIEEDDAWEDEDLYDTPNYEAEQFDLNFGPGTDPKYFNEYYHGNGNYGTRILRMSNKEYHKLNGKK